MGFLHERADSVSAERDRFNSAWQQVAEEWRDNRAQEFERDVIDPYRTELNELERVIREMGDLFEEIGNIQ